MFEKHSFQSPQRVGISEELCVGFFFFKREMKRGEKTYTLSNLNCAVKEKYSYETNEEIQFRNFRVVLCPRNGKAGL